MKTEKRCSITCLICPMACQVCVIVNKKGRIVSVENAHCKRGEEYARQEAINPVRVLTTTVRIDSKDKEHPLLPVKTIQPIPKELLIKAMCELSEISIKPPVNYHDVVLENVANTGVNVVATYERLS